MENKRVPLWQPSLSQIQKANLTSFIREVNNRYQTNLSNFADLHYWSIHHLPEFWQAVWDLCGLKVSYHGKREVHLPQGIFKPQFFIDTELNFAENLLSPRDPDTPTLIFWGEDKVKRTLTFRQVYQEVGRLASYLKSIGVKKGDRVCGYVPHSPEAVMAMLAATSLGAIWSSCSPDFGIASLLDRFDQITPKVLFMAEEYYYNGKRFDCLKNIEEIYKGLPCLEKIIVFPYGDQLLSLPSNPLLIDWERALQPFKEVTTIEFVQVPFNLKKAVKAV